MIGRKMSSVRPIDHVGYFAPTPLLLMGAAQDWRAPPADLDALAAAASEPKERVLFAQGDHVWLQGAGPEVVRAIASFLRQRMREGAPPRPEPGDDLMR
jgi:surfactin synthase thioesterase subunit